jgi:hypothetical protein
MLYCFWLEPTLLSSRLVALPNVGVFKKPHFVTVTEPLPETPARGSLFPSNLQDSTRQSAAVDAKRAFVPVLFLKLHKETVVFCVHPVRKMVSL